MRSVWLVVATSLMAASLLACDSNPPATGGAATAVVEGASAPNVKLTLHDGTSLKLSSLSGSLVLLYFYPKDDTPG